MDQTSHPQNSGELVGGYINTNAYAESNKCYIFC